MTFTPGLELSRLLYEEQVAPVLAERFPGLPYAAATLGMCSEILGLDDEISTDHEWGPRVTIFLAEQDHARLADDIMALLKERLPKEFHGHKMTWRRPGVDVHNTRREKLYHVRAATVSAALRFAGGRKALPLADLAWLKLSEQHLLEFTAGAVYRDDQGDLTAARKVLAYYPDPVLTFLLLKEWDALGGDWFPLGRMGGRGDELGLRVQTARAARRIMRIAFMVSRRYSPYAKWFGALFKALPAAADLTPVLAEMLDTHRWEKIEERISEACAILLHHQNTLGLTPQIALQAKAVDDGRHHLKIEFGPVVNALAQALRPPLNALSEHEVSWLDEKRQILFNDEVGKWSLLLQK